MYICESKLLMYIYVQYIALTWGQADMLFNNLTISKKCPDTVACAAIHTVYLHMLTMARIVQYALTAGNACHNSCTV